MLNYPICLRGVGGKKKIVLTVKLILLQEGRGEVTDISASPGRQAPANQLRPKEPPPMVIQGDFRKVLTSVT